MFEIDFQDFRTWLENKKPYERVGYAGKASCCPVINFLKESRPESINIYRFYHFTAEQGEENCLEVGPKTFGLIWDIDHFYHLSNGVVAIDCLEILNNVVER